MENFATYEKNIKGKIIKIEHTIRFKYGFSVDSIKKSLESVPKNSTVIDAFNEDGKDFFEIIFEEKKQSK